ncbi:Heme chaperone HemW [Buchnera aphidicola (Thelaxes suberi)]|uniref:radical SAM family heme chaperone HemW n=1 Tax=Buchnera aphidicola TaxID=9 RepID=UPI003464909F
MHSVSLYIHIPWCMKKCPYCDFNSYTEKNKINEKKYIFLLMNDLEQDLNLINNKVIIQNIFIGGGTPSLFHINSIDLLLKEIHKRIEIANNAEITIESNPTSMENKKILQYNKIGINRISLGIQTFNNTLLEKIGRNYTINNIEKILTSINFFKKKINFNIDLMYNLPDQSYKEAMNDIKKAISFNPTHISWYELTIEPKTVFFYKKLNLPNEYISEKIFLSGKKLLEKNNYIQYEVSSYSKIGYECQHNLNYWNFGDYLGIGCGAHGKITQENKKVIRTIKFNNIKDYEQKMFLKKKYIVQKKELALEFFMNQCRIKKNILKEDLYNKTGITPQNIQKKINKCITNNLIIEDSNSWKLTKKGYLFINSILENFL